VPQLTVVIRCHNEEKHIGRLLHGIMQQTVKDLEIVVVDSGSTDATLAIASRFPAKIISIKPDEFSFGRSLNLGCSAATSDFIAAASAHVYPVYRDWLEKLLQPFKDSNVGLVYGKQRGERLTKYSEHQILSTWFPDKYNYNQPHPFCNNANVAIRRSLWVEVAYDESLTGLEDLEWAHRIMQNGRRIAYEADAEVIHVHNETPRQTYNRYRREAIALKTIFPKEHFTLSNFLSLYLKNVFADSIHAIKEGVFKNNWVSIPRFRLMQFIGTYRGFNQRGPITTDLARTFYFPNNHRQKEQKVKIREKDDLLIQYDRSPRLYREGH
jgi:rhamnosyltransferase